MSSLTVQDVSKSYGATCVLHNINMQVEDGEFVILVGPSGCGKSTLLRMIAGLENITGGKIAIGSKVINDLPSKARDIAMVFQNYALYPHMSVAENMAFSLKIKRASKEQIKSKVDQAADILGLKDLLNRYPRQLSGGQRQRVAMGRAIVRDPKVFLFDEPLSNLDAKLRTRMRTEVKALHQRLNTTIVYVTHDQIEAMTMADKIVVMRDGVIEQIGSPLEVYDHPANLFVAQFIGSPAMNTFSGVVRTGRTPNVETADGITLPLASIPTGFNGRSVTYGIRPENIRIDPHGLAAEVVVVEPTGPEVQLTLRTGSTEFVAIFRERMPIKAGDIIFVNPDPTQCHLFDIESGSRLSVQ